MTDVGVCNKVAQCLKVFADLRVYCWTESPHETAAVVEMGGPLPVHLLIRLSDYCSSNSTALKFIRIIRKCQSWHQNDVQNASKYSPVYRSLIFSSKATWGHSHPLVCVPSLNQSEVDHVGWVAICFGFTLHRIQETKKLIKMLSEGYVGLKSLHPKTEQRVNRCLPSTRRNHTPVWSKWLGIIKMLL